MGGGNVMDKYYRVQHGENVHLDESRDQEGAFRGTLRDNETNKLVGHANLIPVEDDDDYDFEYGGDSRGSDGALAGLALIGVGIAAVGAIRYLAGSLAERKHRRELESDRAESLPVADQVGTVSSPVPAPAGWYEDGSGRRRWWNGQEWTEHFESEPRPVPTPAGWYEDGSGRRRWWNGQEWTEHLEAPPRAVEAPPGWYDDGAGRMRWWNGQTWTSHFLPAQHHSSPARLASEPEVAAGSHSAFEQPRIRISSAEWQERMRMMLRARAFSEGEWHMLSHAQIDDADDALSQWQSELRQLTPYQFSELINRELETKAISSQQTHVASAQLVERDMSQRGRSQVVPYASHDETTGRGTPVGFGTTHPAGWYSYGPGRRRWWNGRQWTDDWA